MKGIRSTINDGVLSRGELTYNDKLIITLAGFLGSSPAAVINN